MITVHYLDDSRAQRILWLLEELGLSYEIKLYRRGSDMRAPDALKAVHPLGKSPVIEDDGRIVAESGAIIEYLLNTYEGEALRPTAGTEEKLRYTYWMHYAEGSAMPLLLLKLLFGKLPEQVPFFIRPVAALISKGALSKFVDPQLKDHLAFWNAELKRDGWFAGSRFSAADIIMSFPVETAASRVHFDREMSPMRGFLDAIRARPAYQRALQRGGAYRYSTT